jgi:hypothetical protein
MSDGITKSIQKLHRCCLLEDPELLLRRAVLLPEVRVGLLGVLLLWVLPPFCCIASAAADIDATAARDPPAATTVTAAGVVVVLVSIIVLGLAPVSYVSLPPTTPSICNAAATVEEEAPEPPPPLPTDPRRGAWPRSVPRHRTAKFNEHTVSPKLYSAGLMVTKVNTFAVPPRESYINTKTESRKAYQTRYCTAPKQTVENNMCFSHIIAFERHRSIENNRSHRRRRKIMYSTYHLV